jgi:sulfate adenylyltransferase subunit 1
MLLRFITAGNVDDGKSTLTGRLLYDSKNILTDQYKALERATKDYDGEAIDLALLTDSLRAEREQGITIDVAYKYFSTPRRKFILIDAPGHAQFTRNLITGASHSDCMVLIVDARNGITEQTRRHTLVASLLKIGAIILVVNKMDLLEYDESIYRNIKTEFEDFVSKLHFASVNCLPVSALKGENVSETSTAMPWYKGEHLLSILEKLEQTEVSNLNAGRFCVQLIIRDAAVKNYCGYAGKILNGTYSMGDEVLVLPSQEKNRIERIEINGKDVERASCGQNVILHLQSPANIVRGDSIVHPNQLPQICTEFETEICWMDEEPMRIGNNYILQVNSSQVSVTVVAIITKLNIYSLKEETCDQAGLNDMVKIRLRSATPIAVDAFALIKSTGCGILIDERTCNTVGACMIC